MANKIQNSEFKIQNSKSNTAKASGATSMAELMQKARAPIVTVGKGEIVKGIITKLTPSEILVDIHAKTEAVVLEKDKKILRSLLSTLKVGDSVTVSILNPESDNGNSVVSLRRFIDDISWEKIKNKQQSQEALDAVVKEITKGGFLLETKDGFSGFLPNSQTSLMENPQQILGKEIKAFVLELNREEHKIIFSQRAMISPEEFKKIVSVVKIGQKMDAIITTITTFGLFVSLQLKGSTIDGLIHISEIAWERTEDIALHFTVGQKVEAVIIRIDWEAKRVDLSLKRLTSDPFEEIAKKYPIDQKVTGTVTKMISIGVIATIDQDIEGLIRKEKIPPTVSYKIGDAVTATVSEIDNKRHRLILTPVLKEKPIGYR